VEHTVRKKPGDDGKWEVVNSSGEVVATRGSEEAAEDRALALSVHSRLEDLDTRVPRTQMTAEEKAEAWDAYQKSLKEGGSSGPPDPKNDSGKGAPPAPEKKDEPPTADTDTGSGKKERKGLYWGGESE
jgi:hypothetical protein